MMLQTSTHLDEVDLDPNGIGGTVDTNLKTARLDPKGLVVIVRWVVLGKLKWPPIINKRIE